MAQDLERLKQRIPLLEYLQRHNWTGRHASTRQEYPFDVAVLWQAGFRNSTSAFGTNLTSNHISQLCDQPGLSATAPDS